MINFILFICYCNYKLIFLLKILFMFFLKDNPGEFSYYFDTSRRRTCNIAPERFVSESFFNEPNQIANQTLMNQNIINLVEPKMELCSVG